MFAWFILLLLGAIWGASYMFINVDRELIRSQKQLWQFGIASNNTLRQGHAWRSEWLPFAS